MTTIAHVPKEILISSDLSELRVAVLEEGRASEAYVERRGEGSIAGNIYKAKVDNVLRGMEAAFIELGLPKNGFLHVDDVMLPGMDTSSRRKKKIDELLKPGQEVLVQVVKNPMGTKGARVTMELSIAGRFLVLTPGRRGSGRVEAPAGRRARAAAQARQAAGARRRGRDRPHGGRGRDDGGPRARPALLAQDLGADRDARQDGQGAVAGVPRGRPVAARHPRRAVAQRRGGAG